MRRLLRFHVMAFIFWSVRNERSDGYARCWFEYRSLGVTSDVISNCTQLGRPRQDHIHALKTRDPSLRMN